LHPNATLTPRLAAIALFLTLLSACSHRSETGAVVHRYPLSGTILSLNPTDHTAMIDAAAIPNFMEAMTMEYPIRSPEEFKSLHAGDRIRATVNVREDSTYYLSDIKSQKPPPRP
jgi:hypothetical protein